jgi:hypothetical protein
VVQAERSRLAAEGAAGVHPVQEPGAGHFGEQLVAGGPHGGHAGAAGHTRVIGERHVNPLGGQLGGDERDVPGGRMHDHPDVGL